MDAEEILAARDKTVARVNATGTHSREFMGMPAFGRSVEVPLIDIMRFDDAGLVCEHWGVMDMLSMLQQLGAVPDGLPVVRNSGRQVPPDGAGSWSPARRDVRDIAPRVRQPLCGTAFKVFPDVSAPLRDVRGHTERRQVIVRELTGDVWEMSLGQEVHHQLIEVVWAFQRHHV